MENVGKNNTGRGTLNLRKTPAERTSIKEMLA